jgi:hypothetical protein
MSSTVLSRLRDNRPTDETSEWNGDMTDHPEGAHYFVLRQENDETWKLITQLMEPVEAASREEAIAKATEKLDAEEHSGAFLVLSESEYTPINRVVDAT